MYTLKSCSRFSQGDTLIHLSLWSSEHLLWMVTYAMDWMFSLPKFISWKPNLLIGELSNCSLWRWLYLDIAKTVIPPQDGINALIKKGGDKEPLLFHWFSVFICQGRLPCACEDITRKTAHTNKLTILTTRALPFRQAEINFCCQSHLVSSILLWSPSCFTCTWVQSSLPPSFPLGSKDRVLGVESSQAGHLLLTKGTAPVRRSSPGDYLPGFRPCYLSPNRLWGPTLSLVVSLKPTYIFVNSPLILNMFLFYSSSVCQYFLPKLWQDLTKHRDC